MTLKPRFPTGAFNFILLTVFGAYAVYHILSLDFGFLVVVAIIVFVFQLIPTSFFLISNYNFNKRHKFEMQPGKLLAYRNDDCKVISFDSIDRIVIYKSAANPFDSIPLSVVDFFSYAQFIFKNQTELVITSLFVENIGDLVKLFADIDSEVKYGIPSLSSREKHPSIFDC